MVYQAKGCDENRKIKLRKMDPARPDTFFPHQVPFDPRAHVWPCQERLSVLAGVFGLTDGLFARLPQRFAHIGQVLGEATYAEITVVLLRHADGRCLQLLKKAEMDKMSRACKEVDRFSDHRGRADKMLHRLKVMHTNPDSWKLKADKYHCARVNDAHTCACCECMAGRPVYNTAIPSLMHGEEGRPSVKK